MVTLQISVSESTAKSIERKLKERKFAQPGEYIESLVIADELETMSADDIEPEHRAWMMAQVRESLNDDPADAIEVTPEYWEAKRQKLEAMIADRAKS